MANAQRAEVSDNFGLRRFASGHSGELSGLLEALLVSGRWCFHSSAFDSSALRTRTTYAPGLLARGNRYKFQTGQCGHGLAAAITGARGHEYILGPRWHLLGCGPAHFATA